MLSTACLTEKENQSLDELRKHITSLGVDSSCGMLLDDDTCLRYLRARNFNFSKARDMLDATITWRKEFGIDRMTEWKDTMVAENCSGKMYVRGYDKEGHVLVYMRCYLENTTDHKDHMQHLVYNLEKAIACSHKSTKIVMVMDFYGFTFLNTPPISDAIETMRILQNHYPERLAKAYLIHPPWVFDAFYQMCTPFLDSVTQAKACFVPCSQNVGEALAPFIDMADLEALHGGDNCKLFDSNVYLDAPFNVEMNEAFERMAEDKGKDADIPM